MSIQNISGKPNSSFISVNTQKNNHKTESTSSRNQQDSVALTDTAKSLANAEKHLASLPEVNKARINQLQQSINEGSYTVNSEKIAAKILAMEDLLTTNKNTT